MFAFVFNQTNDVISVQRRGAQKRVAVDADEDRELLQRIAQRDQQAFAALYDRYSTVLYSLCLAILKRQDDAEDVLQECFLQIWEKAGAFDGLKGSVYVWLATMTRHRAIDRLRSKQFQISRQQVPDFDFETIAADDMCSPLENASLAERAHFVRKALATLPPAQRQVLQLAYFEGCSQSEIAHHCQIPLGTVKTRTRQAMKKLYARLRNAL